VTDVTAVAYGAPARRLFPRDAIPALASLVAAGVLAGAAAAGHTVLGLVLLLVQAVVMLAWLAYTEVDGAEASAVIVFLGAAAADLLAVRRHGEGVAGAVTVVALALPALLALHLFRPHRQRTAEALAGTISCVVLVVLGAHLLATSARTGRAVAATAVLCAAAALVAGRAGDLLAVRPALVPHSGRGALGLLLALAASAGLGAVLGGAWAPLSVASGTVVGVATGAAAAIADLALALAAGETLDERRTAALRPLTILLPLVVAAPVAYTAARLLVG
jgi:hypothetical protein